MDQTWSKLWMGALFLYETIKSISVTLFDSSFACTLIPSLIQHFDAKDTELGSEQKMVSRVDMISYLHGIYNLVETHTI